jgi:multiple sugar transport system substrate-binding protein
MLQPPIFEATDEGKIATFYIGAFWDEWLRRNCTGTAGAWRAMKAPVFPEVGTGGAPVSIGWCIIDKKPNNYTGLIRRFWYDFQTEVNARNAWSAERERVNGFYCIPLSKKLVADPFWQAPSAYYGGQSFFKAESDSLGANPSLNMSLTSSDTEADAIISAEIEKYVAGEQTMAQAIANMDRELKLKIGKAVMP